MKERDYVLLIGLVIALVVPAVLLLLLKVAEAGKNLLRPSRPPMPPQRPPYMQPPGQAVKPPPAPGAQPGDVVVSGSRWERKLKALFDKANAAGDEQRTAFVAAYIAYVPNLLQQIGAPDLAAAIQIRFFRPQAPPPGAPQQATPPSPKPPAQANGPAKLAPVPNAPT